MSLIFAIVKRFWLGLIRNRANFGFMVVLPIVFTLVFGVVPGASASKVNVSVVDLDKSALSAAIISQMNSVSGYSAKVVTASEATSDLRNLQTPVVLTIPAGFEQKVLSGQTVPFVWQPSPNSGSADIAQALMQLKGDLNQ